MRRSRKRRELMAHDSILATINAPTAFQSEQGVKPSVDMCHKIFKGQMVAMPERKLVNERKSNPMFKEQYARQKMFKGTTKAFEV